MNEREPAKRVGIWIRVSTEDQAQGESPAHHEKRARHYAEAKGWHVAELYDLSGVSGKSVMEHPEAQRMLADIRDGHISGLIFSKLARLARNTKELLEFADIFRDHGAALISLQESIDTSTPAGRLFYTVIAAMAAWEREEIAERVAVSVPIRAKLGKNTGGQASFGYQWVDGELIPEPTEAPIRRRMHELFLEHRRKRTTARLLNEEGYRTRNGSQFTATTVTRLLEDPTAKGLHRANYTKSTGRGKRAVLKPETDWVYSKVEPIVSEEMWDRCHAILEEQRTHRKPPARKSVHLFAGVTVCECGGKMYVPSNSPKYVCRACRNKIPVVDLEGVFHERLKSFFFSPNEIAAYIEEADEALHEKEALINVLFGERDQVAREMDKLYQLYVVDEISKDGFGRRYRPLEERYAQIEDQIPAMQAELDLLKVHYLSADQVVSDAQAFCSRWDQLPREERRDLVEAITEQIVVGKDEVSIELRYLPTMPADDAAASSAQHILKPPSTTTNSSSASAPNDGVKDTNPQGFMAATSWTRAG